MISRRNFLKISLSAGGALVFPWHEHLARLAVKHNAYIAQTSANMLDPTSIEKYVEPLVIPPAFTPTREDGVDVYEIAVRQFQQQILPSGQPQTTVWGYGKAGDPLPGEGTSTFNFPAFTVEARRDQPVRITWINHLVDDPDSDTPQYLPHLFPVDQTVHWANPADGMSMETTKGTPYTGPVPIVTHLHGAHTTSDSDGYPEAWYLPAAANLPENYSRRGPYYGTRADVGAGAAVFEYSNSGASTTSWYHDHALGITRLNVYAGLAGFWLIRDAIESELNLPAPAPQAGDAADTVYYEIPIVIQDRSFNADGSLFYPDSREFFDGFAGPFVPESPVSPIWNPEFFGNTMVVNGRTWPYLEVEPRLYRFRLLNGCNSRFMVLKFDADLNFTQIGAEGGLLSGGPVALDQLLMAPADRADVLVDFSAFAVGDVITLLNLGPDEPFGGFPIEPDVLANAETTGQVMQFRVVAARGEDTASIPAELPIIPRLEADAPERYVTLNEAMYMPADVPSEALLGTVDIGALDWDHAATELPLLNTTEIWNLINFTGDAHPIHLHLVHFQVMERYAMRVDEYQTALQAYYEGGRTGESPKPIDYIDGEPLAPEAWESGWKDTVIVYPGQVTRIIAKFDLEGRYVWHCHILEHEDNEMMRPYEVIGVERDN